MRYKKLLILLFSLYFIYFIYRTIFPRFNFPVPEISSEYSVPSYKNDTIDIKLFNNYHAKSIHQSWKSSTLPEIYSLLASSWSKTHPHWNYILWTDKDNRNLVKDHYPWFLETYDLFHLEIFRIDSVRYLYMHRYGGVYSDLDAESLKPLDEFFNTDSFKIIFGYMGKDRYFRHGIPNAFLGATKPGHPFWLFIIRQIMIEYLDYRNSLIFRIPLFAEYLTGPVQLYESLYRLKDYSQKIYSDVLLLDSSVIFPYNWWIRIDVCAANRPLFDREKCLGLFPNAYVINYWSHVWEKTNGKVNEKFLT